MSVRYASSDAGSDGTERIWDDASSVRSDESSSPRVIKDPRFGDTTDAELDKLATFPWNPDGPQDGAMMRQETYYDDERYLVREGRKWHHISYDDYLRRLQSQEHAEDGEVYMSDSEDAPAQSPSEWDIPDTRETEREDDAEDEAISKWLDPLITPNQDGVRLADIISDEEIEEFVSHARAMSSEPERRHWDDDRLLDELLPEGLEPHTTYSLSGSSSPVDRAASPDDISAASSTTGDGTATPSVITEDEEGWPSGYTTPSRETDTTPWTPANDERPMYT